MIETSCPDTLLEMQTWFAKIITSPLCESDEANLPIYSGCLIDEIRERIAPSPQLKSEERVGIYHQQYWWRLISIMQELYPSLVHLFGYEDFNRLIAEPYLLDCPPHDWFLSRIGSDLPEWLKKNHSSLVLGLACLDLAYERLIFTDILPRIRPEELSKCETEKMYLQPFVMLFELDVDFFRFRAQLLKHPFSYTESVSKVGPGAEIPASGSNIDPLAGTQPRELSRSPGPTFETLSVYWQTHKLPPIKMKRKKTFFVLFRKNEENFYEQISETQFALLGRFQEGATLTDLIPLLTACDNIVEWFQTIASRSWLSFIPKE